MAETTEESGATGAAAGGTVNPFKVFMTQAEFDAHAAKIRHEAERKARTVAADERATMDAMQAELEQRRLRDEEAKGNYEKAKQALEAAAKERVDKAMAAEQKARQAFQTHVVEKELRALALAHGAYDPEDVIARLATRISLDDEYQVRVSDAPGGAVQDGLTMEQAVIDLLKAKPHLAKVGGAGKSAGTSGGASLGSSFSGSPSQREVQAKYEAALERVKANPGDNAALADSMRLKRELEKALAS